jgi:hypothetical protein
MASHVQQSASKSDGSGIRDSGEEAIGRSPQQLSGEAPAAAVAHEEEFADAEVIHQPKLVIGECDAKIVPAIGDV